MDTATPVLDDFLRLPPTYSHFNIMTFVLYVLPVVFCYLLAAVLAVVSRTRWPQIALCFITVMLAFRAAKFLDLSMGKPERKFLNVQLVLAMFCIVQRMLEWTVVKTPLKRYLRPKGSAPAVIMDALDLAGNLRGIGWTWSKGLYVPPQSLAFDSHAMFGLHKLCSTAVYALVCGALHAAVQSFSPDTFGSMSGGTIFDTTLPPIFCYLRSSIIVIFMAFAIYFIMQMGYAFCAFCGVVIFRQDPTQWPPAFDAPWLATSLCEFWGRRWHQWFRRTFIVAGGYPLSLNFGRTGGILGAFLASATFHHVALLTLNDKAKLWRMFLSFGMMGVGLLVERLFRKTTGRRVGGSLGWAWTMAWLVLWGNVMIDGWARAGILGCSSFIDSASPVQNLVRHLSSGSL
ncbi:hypothetical protein F5I97DRAFT_1923733 [Phlebopus sp. FC_14]|nr:hypothetical protein F5I97DRAFT_1923733 [Phlebopus sp. FC_14]